MREFKDFSGYPAVAARLLKALRTRNLRERLAFEAAARRRGVEKDSISAKAAFGKGLAEK